MQHIMVVAFCVGHEIQTKMTRVQSRNYTAHADSAAAAAAAALAFLPRGFFSGSALGSFFEACRAETRPRTAWKRNNALCQIQLMKNAGDEEKVVT